MKTKKYRWNNPQEWLDWAVWEGKVLHGDLMSLIMECIDSDQIQDRFQSEMDRDGYFEETSEDSLEETQP